ncbi:hypothetical protein GCM10025876_15420 [Demequina litorisediminis]|uniref:Uncharacterized protein n=1 Tax=Demequina litorisediminis TaxID=1849022 RepID=A0ABQ6IE11_9MICO|nr:hypothetical protein GCM10025876_15420 [Demequina litorisediminis]
MSRQQDYCVASSAWRVREPAAGRSTRLAVRDVEFPVGHVEGAHRGPRCAGEVTERRMYQGGGDVERGGESFLVHREIVA